MRLRLKEDPGEWMKFAWLAVTVSGGIAGWLFYRNVIGGIWFAALLGMLGLGAVLAYVRPVYFRPVYRAAMTGSFYLGQVTGRIVLGLTFLTLVLPLGLALRLAGKDLLGLKKRMAGSYWRSARVSNDFNRMF